MNFIGHATVALWNSAEPRFVLGSMLPDFAGMAGTRLVRTPLSADATLAAGIALHHRTDDAFHAAPGFTLLLQETLDGLTARGVPRGTARAVAHIGVELLIDGELVADALVADAYTSALQQSEHLEHVFVDSEGATRWERLRTRLLAYGVPYDYRDPDSVLRRLEHVLRARPRLAIDPASAAIVRETLPPLQRRVVAELPELLRGLRARLP